MQMRLAYLCPAEVDPALRWIAARRGPEWIRSQVGWKTASPYGVHRGLSGLEGWISLYRAYTELCVRLLGEIEVGSLHLRASPRRWAANRRELLRTLSIPYRIDACFHWMQLRESVRNWRFSGSRLQGPQS
jgi:hypothetical protein